MTDISQPGSTPSPNRSGAVVAAVAAVLVVVLAVVGIVLLSNDDSDQLGAGETGAGAPAATPEGFEEEVPPSPVEEPVEEPAAAAGPCAYTPGEPPSRPVEAPKPDEVPTSGGFTFALDTSAGPISFVADAAKTPCTVGALRSLAAQKYYDGTSCHRLTTEGIFVLQCGDPTGSGAGGPGYSYADEALEGAVYPAGTVAMANAGPDTNGSQFFLVYEDTQLPPSYTPLGRITQGLEAVRAVAKAGTEEGGSDGAPKTPVEIRTVRVTGG